MGSGEKEITVVLAADHTVIRSGLRALLEAEDDLRVIGEAADAPGAQKLVRDRRPDVLVLDLQMPGAEPAGDIQLLREAVPATSIVVLTMQADPRRARELLQAGAAGYVLKQAAERQLTAAIRSAAGGGSYIDPELGGQVAQLGADPLEALGDRDRELLRLLALGHTTARSASSSTSASARSRSTGPSCSRSWASNPAPTWSASRSPTALSTPAPGADTPPVAPLSLRSVGPLR